MGERIAVVTTSFPSTEDDAAGHFVAAEVTELLDQGHSVTVIAPGHGCEQRGRLRIVRLGGGTWFGTPGALLRLRAQPFEWMRVLYFVLDAQSMLQRQKFDRILAHWLLPCGWPIATRVGGKIEVVAHGSDVRLLARLPRPIAAAIVDRLMSRNATVRFVSHELQQLLAHHTRSRWLERSSVEPSLIELPAISSRETTRAARGIRADAFVVMVIGRLVLKKRPSDAIERALTLNPERIFVIGSGPLRAELEPRYPQAEFLGHLSRVETLTWLAAADLLICASVDEGAPTVVREARALGVPCWCATCGDLAIWADVDSGLRLFHQPPPQRSLSRGSRSTKLHGRVRLSS